MRTKEKDLVQELFEDYADKMEIPNDNIKYLAKKKNDLILYKYKENEIH